MMANPNWLAVPLAMHVCGEIELSEAELRYARENKGREAMRDLSDAKITEGQPVRLERFQVLGRAMTGTVIPEINSVYDRLVK